MQSEMLTAAKEAAQKEGTYENYLGMLEGVSNRVLTPKVRLMLDVHHREYKVETANCRRILRKSKNPSTRARVAKELSDLNKNMSDRIEELIELSPSI